MVCKGSLVRNWDFFRQQWEDYEVTAGLEKQDSKITLAFLRCVMGKDCRQKFLNLSISDENRKNVQTCLTTLENYFKPQRNVVYQRYVFNSCKQNPGGSVDSYVARLRIVSRIRITHWWITPRQISHWSHQKRDKSETFARDLSIIKQDFIDVFEGLGYIGCSNFVVDPSVVPV